MTGLLPSAVGSLHLSRADGFRVFFLRNVAVPRLGSRLLRCAGVSAGCSGLAGAIAVFPSIGDAGLTEDEADEIGKRRLGANGVGQQQHASAAPLETDEAVARRLVVAPLEEPVPLRAVEHDHP